jgi:hypothetical protein
MSKCCDFHNRTCEPPSELCCGDCTEFHHGMHQCGPQFRLGHHGQPCVLEFRPKTNHKRKG